MKPASNPLPAPLFQQPRLLSQRGMLASTLQSILLFAALLLVGCDRQTETGSKAFDIADYQGKWVVLNYWAEWCAPCIKEIPELNALDADHAAQLEVLGVNFDRIHGEELQQLSKRMGIRFQVLDEDPVDQLRLARPASLPTTYLFDPSGELKAKLVGPQTSESLLERMRLLE